MGWYERSRGRLEAALNESEVVGVRILDGAESVAILLQVSALPESGPMDADSRRRLILHGVSEVRLLLRAGTVDDYGPAIPLEDPDAVERFFDSKEPSGSRTCRCGGPMALPCPLRTSSTRGSGGGRRSTP